jgi:uncharacterized protein YndB with AHSA1/START domain
MSVKKEAGRRYVELTFEVPGTPEDVWQAIATGPGISAWFVPAQVEERDGGKLAFEIMQGVHSKGYVTGWQPPRRFAYEETEWSENAPPLATECSVEARGGGTCVVRMVHSLFTDKTDWDKEMEGFEAGWPPYFDVLRLYLTRFKGQRAEPLRLMMKATGDQADAWKTLARPLGLQDASPGSSVRSSRDAPELAGVVERTGSEKNPNEVLLRLESPAPGAGLIGAYTWGGQTYAIVNLYLYGPAGEAAMPSAAPAWTTWLGERFPENA